MDEGGSLIGWQSLEQDPGRNSRLWPLLAQARDRYAAGIAQIEEALTAPTTVDALRIWLAEDCTPEPGRCRA